MKRLVYLLIFLPLFSSAQIKVSEMTAATGVNDADVFLLVQSGSSKKVAYSVFKYTSDEAATQIGDSLTLYRIEFAEQIQDSIDAIPEGTVISFGTEGQIPFTDAVTTDFNYSSNFVWDGTSFDLSTGTRNIFIGTSAGASTTGTDNIFIGLNSGYVNVTGDLNTFVGTQTGRANTTGDFNSFYGSNSGYSNTAGYRNNFIGYGSGRANTTGNDNTFIGYDSGVSSISGSGNAFLGNTSGEENTTGANNTFIGNQAGNKNTTGHENVFTGKASGFANTTGYQNVFTGYLAGRENLTGINNTYTGTFSGQSHTGGNNNSFFGIYSGYSNLTGANNTFIGGYSGYDNLGSSNVFLGYQAGQTETGSNKLYISNSSTDTLIYGEFDNDILHLNADVTIDGDVFADNLTAVSATENQIPYVNSTGDGYEYSANFTWNDTTLGVNYGYDNVFIGQGVADNGNLSGEFTNYNTVIGANAAPDLYYSSSVIIGHEAGYNTANASGNVFIGRHSGYSNITGNSNVFIGTSAGYNETGSNKLHIENSNTTTPLIYGEFDNNLLVFNTDTTTIKGHLKVDSTLYTNLIINGTGTISDNDATPDISNANIWTYNGTANAVTITDFDNPTPSTIITIIGNSDTYTVTINDSGNFNTSEAIVLGACDVVSFLVVADNNYIQYGKLVNN